MRIFGKHIFRSIRSNPKQPLLISLIVSLCVAVVILSVALPVNIYKNERGRMLADEWTADVEITLKATSEHRLIFCDEVSEIIGERGSAIGEFALTGFYTPDGDGAKSTVSLGAFDLQEAHAFYCLQYLKIGKFTNKNIDKSAIIGEGFATKYGLTVGDTVRISVLGEEFSYTVEAIAKEKGIMKRESILVDISSIRAVLSERSPIIASLSDGFSPYTRVQIRLNDGVDASLIKAELEASELFADKKVSLPKDSSNSDYMSTLLSVTALIPAMMLLIVAVMMTVSTFDLLQKKRSDDLALFRTVGADAKQINLILYLESGVYSVVGAVFGSLLSLPLMRLVNGIYGFAYSRMRFGVDDALIGLTASLGFVAFCTWSHVRKQKKKSLSEGLRGGNLDTDRRLLGKVLILSCVAAVLLTVTAILPVGLKFISAFSLLLVVMVFVYVASPYFMRAAASLLARLLAGRRRGAGDFVLAARSCENSYPLRHAGRITALLVTVFISLSTVLTAARDEVSSFVDFIAADYVGVMADDGTKARLDDMDGVRGVAEASMKSNVIFEGGKSSTGISVRGDLESCFDIDALPKNLPSDDSVAISHGLARMLGVKVGDLVKCEIGGIPCELTVTEIVDTQGDFVYYDAAHIGSGYDTLCVLTDGTEEAYRSLLALFDERGVECLSTDEYFSFVHERMDPQLIIFNAMFYTMIVLGMIGILNVLAEQRMARKREFDVMIQVGKTKNGVVMLQLVEIIYLLVFSLLIAAVFAQILCLIIDMALISFGMTLYA